MLTLFGCFFRNYVVGFGRTLVKMNASSLPHLSKQPRTLRNEQKTQKIDEEIDEHGTGTGNATTTTANIYPTDARGDVVNGEGANEGTTSAVVNRVSTDRSQWTFGS